MTAHRAVRGRFRAIRMAAVCCSVYVLFSCAGSTVSAPTLASLAHDQVPQHTIYTDDTHARSQRARVRRGRRGRTRSGRAIRAADFKSHGQWVYGGCVDYLLPATLRLTVHSLRTRTPTHNSELSARGVHVSLCARACARERERERERENEKESGRERK